MSRGVQALALPGGPPIANAHKEVVRAKDPVVIVTPGVPAVANAYKETDLVSNIPGRAATTDPNLVNPWGITASSSSPWWVANNHTGVSTLYNGAGQKFPLPPSSPLVVTIPTPPGGKPPSAPTGIVSNTSTTNFLLNGAGTAAHFIFVTEDGTISGWNSGTSAVLKVDNSGKGAVYKGAALANNGGATDLYVTNFHANRIEVYNSSFQLVNSFTDRHVHRNFAPFGIEDIGNVLYVTYAKQKLPDKHDDQAGPGNGFVDAFSPSGQLLSRVATRGPLNSPWGLALAPSNFGRFSNDLLVGNFGDGRINAYQQMSTRGGVLRYCFAGQLDGTSGKPITIDNLWSLGFGNGAGAGSTNTLFFTAGLNDEQNGLFGTLTSSTT